MLYWQLEGDPEGGEAGAGSVSSGAAVEHLGSDSGSEHDCGLCVVERGGGGGGGGGGGSGICAGEGNANR